MFSNQTQPSHFAEVTRTFQQLRQGGNRDGKGSKLK